MIYEARSVNWQIGVCSVPWVPLCSQSSLLLHRRLRSPSLPTSPPRSWTTLTSKQFVTIYRFHRHSSGTMSPVSGSLSAFPWRGCIGNGAFTARQGVTGERERKTGQDWTGQSRTAFIKLKKTTTQPNSGPGPQPIFRIRKVLSHFPVSTWLEPASPGAREAVAPLLLNCFLFWKIIRNFI